MTTATATAVRFVRLRRAWFGGVVLLSALAAACSGSDAGVCGGIVAPVRVLTPAPAALTLNPGAEGQVTASLSGGCDSDDRTVRWASSNALIATVNASGRVQAVSSGTATLTATAFDNRASTTVAITVRARVATTIDATPALDTIAPFGTRTLAVSVRDQTGTAITTPGLAWRSLTSSIATVSPVGVVTGVTVGAASIEVATPRAGADSLRDTVRIVVVPACNIVRAVALGTSFTGSFDAATCQNLYGFRIANQHTITVTEPTYFSITLVPTASAILVPLHFGSIVSALPAAATPVTSLVAVRAGTFGFLAAASAPSTATYTISTARDPDARADCLLTTATTGVTFRSAITPTCQTRDVRLLPALSAGQVVRVTSTAASFPVVIELRNAGSGAVLARSQAAAAGAPATISYINVVPGPLVLIRISGSSGAANDYVTVAIAQ